MDNRLVRMCIQAVKRYYFKLKDMSASCQVQDFTGATEDGGDKRITVTRKLTTKT
jgi:hypothetical protein